MMSYRDCLVGAMEFLAEKDDTIVVAYNSTAGGTIKSFPENRRIEMPLAEALCGGVALGLSLGGFIPLVWVERSDFLTIMSDQIVNHADKIAQLSDGIHKPACIYRVCVGNKQKPLFTGPTHCQDFSRAFTNLVSFPVIQLKWQSSILKEYEKAYRRAKEGVSTMLFEYKDLY